MKEPVVTNPSQTSKSTRTKPKAKRSGMVLWNGLYIALLAVFTLSNIIGPERWWVGGLNLYLPQWLWVLPAFPLLFLTLMYDRKHIWVPGLAFLWGLGPIMGFTMPMPWHALGTPQGTRLRVMTYNIKAGSRSTQGILQEIADTKPDIILFQEAMGTYEKFLRPALPGWNVQTVGQHLVATKLPLTTAETGHVNTPNGFHRYLRCEVQVGDTAVTLCSVHLVSPRSGLVALRHPRAAGMKTLEDNLDSRLYQANSLSLDVRQMKGPLILAGDLNAPPASIVCKQLEQLGLKDAFSAAGRGYGYSYGHFTRLRHDYLRIDHIYTSEQIQVVNCWVGNNTASDHCPVIADIILTK